MTVQKNGFPIWYGPEDYLDFPISVNCSDRTKDTGRLEWCLHNLPEHTWCFDPFVNIGVEYRFKNPDDAVIFKLKFA